MKNSIRLGILALLLTILGLTVSLLQFQHIHPLGGIDVVMGREAILRRAESIAESLHIQTSGYIVNIEPKRAQDLIRQVQERFGVAEGNALLRTRIHAYSWAVSWGKPGDMTFSMGSGQSSTEEVKDVATALGGQLRIGLSFTGGLTELEIKQTDSLGLPLLSSQEAHAMADAFLAGYAQDLVGSPEFHFVSEKRIELPKRTDYEFLWSATDSILGNPLTAKVRVAGNRIAGFSIGHEAPLEYRGTGKLAYQEVAVLSLFVLLIVTMIVVALKKIRSNEIGWRTGLSLGIIAAVMLAIEMFNSLPQGLNLALLVAVIIAPLFYGGVLVLSWSVAESVGREAWKGRFLTIDLLTKGYVLDSRVATSVLLGISLGATANAVWTLAAWGAESATSVWYSVDSGTTLKYLAALSPGLFLLVHVASMKLFVISALVVFPMALLRRWIGSAPLLIAVMALILPLLEAPTLHPWIPGYLVEACSVAVILWSLTRFDVLTAYGALVTAEVFGYLPVLLFSADHSVAASGIVVAGLIGGAMAMGWIGILTKDRITDTDAIVPAFARLITERERMYQELQIAREVQMSLLPKSTPAVPGLDIASRCVPALEVGGDYYDFVLPGDGRLGVVVGDVSGKGTEGAFYMTLTKGFLKAVTRMSNSPSAVLTEANSLFYDNVERGNFISLIYALIDPQAGTVTIARAGHNPAILCRSNSGKAEEILPKGIALGLEPGDVFRKTIEEVTVPFGPGDLLVLNTDGFEESVNRKGEQFGDDRLLSAVTALVGRSANDVLDGILKAVTSFVGKSTQHDDMTIVVVRRT